MLHSIKIKFGKHLTDDHHMHYTDFFYRNKEKKFLNKCFFHFNRILKTYVNLCKVTYITYVFAQTCVKLCISNYMYRVSIIKLEICQPSVAKTMQRNDMKNE